jgi:flagellar hook-length control protein FliK
VTSVAPEASALAYRTAKTDRPARPTGMREDGAFAAMMDSESRPEPQRSEKPAGRTAARETERATDRPDAPSSAVSKEASKTAPGEASQEPTAEASRESPQPSSGNAAVAQETGNTDTFDTTPANTADAEEILTGLVVDPAAIVIAAVTPPATPTIEPALPVAAAMPTQPDIAVPAVATPVETAPTAPAQSAPAVPVAAPADAAAQTPAAPAANASADAQTQAQSAAAQADAKPKPAAEKSNEAEAASRGTTSGPPEAAASEETLAQSPTHAKQAPAQAAPARPETTANKPETQASDIVNPEEPAVSGKHAFDPAVQPAPLAAPAHAATIQATTPQSAPVSAAQPVPVNAIAVEIASQARAGNSRFEIRLDPPELGRIDVRLDIDNDGNVKSRLVIERADTYDLLRRDQSTLERALQQAGLKTSDNGLEFSLRDQGFAQRQDSDDSPRGMRVAVQDTELPPSEAANGYARLLGGRSGVDIRV